MALLKGFVGPLGDDIPSIFPIIAGVLLFISTVAYAAYFTEQKNDYLNTRKAALGLAYQVTKTGSVTLSDFNSACGNVIRPYADSRGVKFAVVLKKFCRKIALNSYPFDPKTYAVRAGKEEIGGAKDLDGAACASSSIDVEELADPKNMPLDAVILNYPIAVNCPDEESVTRGLGMVNVMVWKKPGKLEEASAK